MKIRTLLIVLTVPLISLFALDIQAEQLAKTLKSNILKFKKDYEGKTIQVTGKVGQIKQSNDDFVLIINYKYESYSDPSIWCQLNQSSMEAAATLKEDSAVKVKGKIGISDAINGNKIIDILDCSIQ